MKLTYDNNSQPQLKHYYFEMLVGDVCIHCQDQGHDSNEHRWQRVMTVALESDTPLDDPQCYEAILHELAHKYVEQSGTANEMAKRFLRGTDSSNLRLVPILTSIAERN
jgi:hypothetical protein